MTQVGVHPALNRFIAGLDMITGGVRVLFNAAGPEDLENLKKKTAAAFEEMARREADTAVVIEDLHRRLIAAGDLGVLNGSRREAYERVFKRRLVDVGENDADHCS